MLVSSLALAVGIAIYDITVREIDLSGTATQSQYAIYASDTGAECALYWDLHCPSGLCAAASGGSAFASSSAMVTPNSGVVCNTQDIRTTGTSPIPYAAPPTGWTPWTSTANATAATTTFTVVIGTGVNASCATVIVAKSGNPTATTVTSKGYNTCASIGIIRLERVLQVSY